ncbi:TPA: hypothetical protein I8552_003716 [Serratia marcescens]|nr:hypothetical protein [Serratia marcescens]
MASKHRELNEFEFLKAKVAEEAAQVGESEEFDESEEIDDSEYVDESLKARRRAYIEYQNARKKKLKTLGEHQIQVRLDDETYERLCDLSEVLGYRRPKDRMRNLVEMYSTIFKYLLRTSDESFGYKPSTSRSIKILGIYKYVDHLKNEQQLPKDAILAELKKKGEKIPISKIGSKQVLSGNEKFLERFFDKNKILKLLKEMDGEI